ncbi:MAG: GHKL domain-containing protein, partial [Sphingomonadaceae bacterium]|nr:GHKL domain-containing protein [Sphingomonadaceae bacterium]
LFEVANPDIDFTVENDQPNIAIRADRRQLGQAATNILKNAVESIRARLEADPSGSKGRIAVTVGIHDGRLRVSFADNGQGLPDVRERILEPYVTTRATGSGLGLAIVSKIIEEHEGDLTFSDANGGGAILTMTFPLEVRAHRHEEQGPN